MISLSDAQLSGILDELHASRAVRSKISAFLAKGDVPVEQSLYVYNGRLRSHSALADAVFVGTLAHAGMLDDWNKVHFADSLSDEGVFEIGRCIYAFAFLDQQNYEYLYLKYEQPEIALHSLCLDDICVQDQCFSVRGRNLSDLDFGGGDLKGVYGEVEFFDFSCNPSLKTSQIRSFLEQNGFAPRRLLCCGMQVDCTLPSGWSCFDYDEIAELDEISFDMAEPGRVYPKCLILRVAATQLEAVSLQMFPQLVELKVSTAGEFSLPLQLSDELNACGRIPMVNGKLWTGMSAFSRDKLHDYEFVRLCRSQITQRIGKAKILFQKKVARKICQNGALQLSGVEDNALFCLFCGIPAGFAERAMPSEANFQAIYHSTGNDIVYFLVQTKEIEAFEPLIVGERWFDSQANCPENAIVCYFLNGQATASHEFQPFSDDNTYNKVRNLNQQAIISKRMPTVFFEAMPYSIALLCQSQGDVFIDYDLRRHTKAETVFLLIAGLIRHCVAQNGYCHCAIVTHGSIEAASFSYSGDGILPELGESCAGATVYRQLPFEDKFQRAVLLLDAETKRAALLDIEL